MATFEVILRDRTAELIGDVDGYQQEGQMTTFFRSEGQRPTLDAWCTRVGSFRTSEILIIRRLELALRSTPEGELAASSDQLPAGASLGVGKR